MVTELKEGLTFDDVLIEPRRSRVSTRKDVETSTRFSRRISLQIPIVSANMSTVTEADMAIAMAREGGLGVIHRFMRIEDEVEQVARVKRSENIIIEQPYTIGPGKQLADARKVMDEGNITSLLVASEEGDLLGILTHRDVLFVENTSRLVSELMTPAEKLVTVSPGVTPDEAKRLFRKYKVEKFPIVDENGRLVGLITIADILKRSRYPLATKDEKGRLRVAAAVGVRGDFLDRAEALTEAGVDAIVVDVAHGHSDHALEASTAIRKRINDTDLVVGNVATARAVRELIELDVDAIKVGIGPGSICITRLVTGSGVPQLSAVLECSREAADRGIPIIADGGIRTSGDITKALAAGAANVMLGSLLAGTEESPGVIVIRGGLRHKVCWGSASLWAQWDARSSNGEDPAEVAEVVPEGVEAVVPYKGLVSEVLNHLVGGLRSGISYAGARNISELRKNASFIKITPAGLNESHPHDVDPVK
jgi:IMP dehydrogenase